MPDADTLIALQLYSVREDAKRDLHWVLRQAMTWGLDGVEFAGFYEHSAEDVKAMLDDAGLKCPSTHTGIDQLGNEHFNATVDYHKTIGCDTILIPWLPPERRNTLDACMKTAVFFNELIEKLRPLGMRTGFHVHSPDVLPLDAPAGDGRSPWDIFAEQTPNDFILQYDTANGMDGGADPVAPIRRHPGRSVLLHLKEYGDGAGTFKGREGHGKAVLGEGDVPWREVFDAAQSVGGTRWYIIEQEGHPSLSPMDAAQQCVANLQRMLAE